MPDLVFRRGRGWREVEDAALPEQDSTLVWVDVDVSTAGRAEAGELASRFELNELAVEDALNPKQRPKLESYDTHRFLVLHQLDEVEDQLEARQIAVFAGDRFVVVLHHGADRLVADARKRLHQVEPEEVDVDRALHALLDAVVDDDQRIADRLTDDIENLENRVLAISRRADSGSARAAHHLPSQSLLYGVKQQVSMLRRYAVPVAGVVERLEPAVASTSEGEEMELLYRDVHDHLLRIAGQIKNIDELAAAVLDLTRSVQADTLNEVNKKLSAWAGIIAVPTLIASIYGTNYTLWPSPRLHVFGFVMVLAIMVGSGTVLWLFFKRKRWI
jgi:magnesium transporter